jgi:hypothetical protein
LSKVRPSTALRRLLTPICPIRRWENPKTNVPPAWRVVQVEGKRERAVV